MIIEKYELSLILGGGFDVHFKVFMKNNHVL